MSHQRTRAHFANAKWHLLNNQLYLEVAASVKSHSLVLSPTLRLTFPWSDTISLAPGLLHC